MPFTLQIHTSESQLLCAASTCWVSTGAVISFCKGLGTPPPSPACFAFFQDVIPRERQWQWDTTSFLLRRTCTPMVTSLFLERGIISFGETHENRVGRKGDISWKGSYKISFTSFILIGLILIFAKRIITNLCLSICVLLNWLLQGSLGRVHVLQPHCPGPISLSWLLRETVEQGSQLRNWDNSPFFSFSPSQLPT